MSLNTWLNLPNLISVYFRIKSGITFVMVNVLRSINETISFCDMFSMNSLNIPLKLKMFEMSLVKVRWVSVHTVSHGSYVMVSSNLLPQLNNIKFSTNTKACAKEGKEIISTQFNKLWGSADWSHDSGSHWTYRTIFQLEHGCFLSTFVFGLCFCQLLCQ